MPDHAHANIDDVALKRSGLATLWIGTITISLLCLPVAPLISTLCYFVAVVLALVTWVGSSKQPLPLRYRGWYRAAIGTLFVVAVAGVVSAGNAFAVNRETGDQHVMLVCLASTFALISILSWRALVRPTPRRAAGVALLALAGVVTALVIDLVLDANRGNTREEAPDWTWLLLVGALFGSWIAGALVSLASVTTFRRSVDESDLPEARQLPPA